jgi:general secretion pathway protein A
MFTDYYNLSDLPFAEGKSIEPILRDERFETGLVRLDYFLKGGNLAILTGPTGVGKSSLLHTFADTLPGNRYQVIYLHLTHVKSTALLRMIVTALGEKPRMGKDRLFGQILEKVSNGEQVTILSIDEAHLLSEEALVDLRLLLSTGENNLKLILAGQNGLHTTLSRSSLADLVNRITVRLHLAPLTMDQTLCYLDHRITRTGGTGKLIDDAAKEKIHEYTGGVPRAINNLATISLIQGAAKKQKRITEALVDDAAAEMRIL